MRHRTTNTLSRAAIVLALFAAVGPGSALAQRRDAIAGAIPPGTGFLCAFTRSTTTYNGVVLGKRNEPVRGTITAVLPRTVVHCSSSQCYRFEKDDTLSRTAQVFISEKGDKLTTGLMALALGAGIQIEVIVGQHAMVIGLAGDCEEKTEAEINALVGKGMKP